MFCDRYIVVQWLIKERKENGWIYLREQNDYVRVHIIFV